jgi:hypothetical protein
MAMMTLATAGKGRRREQRDLEAGRRAGQDSRLQDNTAELKGASWLKMMTASETMLLF